jgi:hypothetical protein
MRRNVNAKNYQDLGKETIRMVSVDENLCSFSNAAEASLPGLGATGG